MDEEPGGVETRVSMAKEKKGVRIVECVDMG